jgi:hypothetical protein
MRYCITSCYKSFITWLVYVPSPHNTQHEGVRAKTCWPEIRIVCTGGSTCLPADWCFSELLLNYKSVCWSRTKWTSSASSSYQNVTYSRHNIAEYCSFDIKLTQSKKNLKISKGWSESVNRIRTDNTMTKRKETNNDL